MTPAQRGITGWAPHVAAGYVPASALSLNVNSVNGWPTPCGFAPADWPFVIGTFSRFPAGDRLTGDEIDGYAIFGEVTVGFGEKFDLTVGYRYHNNRPSNTGSTSRRALRPESRRRSRQVRT